MSYNTYGVDTTLEFDAWLSGINPEARAAVTKRVLRVAAGNLGDTRSVGKGVFELRIHLGPGYRVYFCRWKDGIAMLLCGGDKSTQARDIALAQLMRSKLPWQ